MATASAHLSKELKELIKSIGETKSKQEQDRIILGQLASLKTRITQKNLSSKNLREHLIRALYIQMLGHSSPFAHIHAINLTQNKNLQLKRLGYLMCSLFFDKDSDLMIMLVATILKDLASTDVHQVVICLTSLGSIMNSTIAAAILEPVTKLLVHTTDLVRKKAILVIQKIKSSTGTQVPDYKDKMKKGLCDRQPSVMAAALNLYLDEVKQNPRKYRDLAGSFVIILKQVIQHKLPKQFDYHRMPAPWIQMRLLKILQILGKGDQKASEHAYAILQQVLRRSEETNNNISIAVTYQCIKTIATIYPREELMNQAASVLGKLLQSRSTNNMKYLGIQALSMLYRANPKLLDQYQLIIVQCLESKDETLKKQTLDLLFKMTTQDNVEIIVSKMLNSLHASTDNYFRNTLVLKITQLAQRFSVTHKWYLDTMQILFELGSQYLSEDILNNFLKLVTENYNNNSSFGEEIIVKMIQLNDKIVPTDFVIKAVTWIIGEIGSSYYAQDSEKLAQLSKIIIKTLDYDYEKQSTKKWPLDALVKISSVSTFKNHSEVKIILEKYARHGDIQVYQRALESRRLAKYNAALKNSFEIQSKFRQGLPFLSGFVQNARLNGAREYKKIKVTQQQQQQLRFVPYPTQQAASSFKNWIQQKQQKKQVPSAPVTTYEQRVVQPPVFVSKEPTKEKPSKPIIPPQEKAKQKMAQNLFGGLKGPSSKPAPVQPKQSEGQPKKKTQKVENADLI